MKVAGTWACSAESVRRSAKSIGMRELYQEPEPLKVPRFHVQGSKASFYRSSEENSEPHQERSVWNPLEPGPWNLRSYSVVSVRAGSMRAARRAGT